MKNGVYYDNFLNRLVMKGRPYRDRHIWFDSHQVYYYKNKPDYYTFIGFI
jgi:hypothetical protein